MKCRATSSSTPRQANRGASVICTNGTGHGPAAARRSEAGGRSCRSVWVP
jgi:hypothetical protein